jgi:hypothetical protein
MMKTRPEVMANRAVGNDLDAFSISQFCRRHGLSVASFYKFKDQMPATFSVGTRVLISREAAEMWRREREAQQAQQAV